MGLRPVGFGNFNGLICSMTPDGGRFLDFGSVGYVIGSGCRAEARPTNRPSSEKMVGRAGIEPAQDFRRESYNLRPSPIGEPPQNLEAAQISTGGEIFHGAAFRGVFGGAQKVFLNGNGGWWADCPPYIRRAGTRTSPDRGMAILGVCGALYGCGVIGRLRGVQVEIVSPARGAGLAMSGAFGLIPDKLFSERLARSGRLTSDSVGRSLHGANELRLALL